MVGRRKEEGMKNKGRIAEKGQMRRRRRKGGTRRREGTDEKEEEEKR